MSCSDDIGTVREKVGKYRKGDEKAFQWLVERYDTGLCKLVYKMTRDNMLKEDLMQEIWFKVWDKRDTYINTSEFSTWIYTIARNHTIDYFKASGHRFNDSMLSADSMTMYNGEEIVPEYSEGLFRRGFGPDAVIESEELKEKIMQSIGIIKENGYSKKITRALELRIDGLPYENIAEELKIRLGSVKSDIRRGRILAARKTLELLGDCKETPAIVILRKFAAKPIG